MDGRDDYRGKEDVEHCTACGQPRWFEEVNKDGVCTHPVQNGVETPVCKEKAEGRRLCAHCGGTGKLIEAAPGYDRLHVYERPCDWCEASGKVSAILEQPVQLSMPLKRAVVRQLLSCDVVQLLDDVPELKPLIAERSRKEVAKAVLHLENESHLSLHASSCL